MTMQTPYPTKKRLTSNKPRITTLQTNTQNKKKRSVFSLSPETPKAVDITEQERFTTPTKPKNSKRNDTKWSERQPNPLEFKIPPLFDDDMITSQDNLPAVGDENGAYLHLLTIMEKAMNNENPMRLPLNTLITQYKKFCRTLLQIMAENTNIEWIAREKRWSNTMGYVLWSSFPTNHWETWPGHAITQTIDAEDAANRLKSKGAQVVKWFENCKEADTITMKIIGASLEFCHAQKHKLTNLAYLPRGAYDNNSVNALTNGHILWKTIDEQYRNKFFTEFSDLLPSVDTMNALTLQGFRLTTRDLILLPPRTHNKDNDLRTVVT